VPAIPTEFEHLPGDVHIVPTVAFNQVEPPFLVPAQRVQPLAGFAPAQCGFGDAVQAHAKTPLLGDFFQQVQCLLGAELAEVHVRPVPPQDRVVKILDIEPDHPRGGEQFIHKTVRLRFAESGELAGGIIVQDRQGQFELMDVLLAADFLEAALGFQVEYNLAFGRSKEAALL